MDGAKFVTPARLRTPRVAAIAGIAFSVILGAALVLVRISVPSDPSDAGEWLTDRGKRAAVAFALNLVPFAGIAFLWFIGVVRDRIGEHEDRFFATVFLGSGVLFIGMLFVGAAVAAGVLADPNIEAGRIVSSGSWGLGQRVTQTVLNVYAIRMGAVFILSTTTIGVRTRIVPRWLAAGGYVAALVLLVGTGLSLWVNILLPVWVLVLSGYILIVNVRMERT